MIHKKFSVFLLFAFLLVFLAYPSENVAASRTLQEEKEPEVISLLGKKLYATPATGEELLKLQGELREAIKAVEANPEDPESIIMYGRRLAYLWRYREAIDVYSKGIEKFPDHAMLYRHRGHRYISVRKFDKAVVDLTRASELNDHDFDIWYHQGLAHYLRGEFQKALDAYQSCIEFAKDDDSKIAISNWLCITHRRLGKEDDALRVLDKIKEGMEVEENQSYHSLLLFYKGQKTEAEISAMAEASDLDMATIGYGIGCWYLHNSQKKKAVTYFEKIVKGKYWPAFGFIAAEAELARMK